MSVLKLLQVKKVVDVRDLPLTTSVSFLWSHWKGRSPEHCF